MISIGEIVAVYVVIYVVVLNYGYHLTLPWYSNSIRLKTGRDFYTQWRWRRMRGQKIMRTISIGYLASTGILTLLLLIIPIQSSKYVPMDVSIHHDIVQDVTVVIADKTVYKTEYFEKGWYLIAHKESLMFTKYRPILIPWHTAATMIINIPPPEDT